MKEEDIFPTPPDAPSLSLWQRMTSSMYFWWMLAFLLMGLAVILISSQCSTDAMNFPEPKSSNLDDLPFVDQDKELAKKSDGLWYRVGEVTPFDGLAVTFYPNGKKKTRTQFKEGLAIGLIEEWDANGSSVGPRFKGEFTR